MSKLYLMMGCPGSGKSTFCREHLKENDLYISRDEIRFNMVKEGEPYFSKENAVFKEYVNKIVSGLRSGKDVYADATHLNRGSREKLLRAINHYEYESAQIIWIRVPLNTAIKQNENRKGTRAYVPPEVIQNMHRDTQEPVLAEGFKKIYIVTPDNKIEIREEEM